LGAAVGLGYVTAANGAVVGAVDPEAYEVEVAGVRYPATASLRPLYDPTNERIKR
jgi:4-methylaminobutanoate oxidase (formaldehyde-forming)